MGRFVILWVPLLGVAHQVGSLLVSAGAARYVTFIKVLVLMLKFMSLQVELVLELFVAEIATKLGFHVGYHDVLVAV